MAKKSTSSSRKKSSDSPTSSSVNRKGRGEERAERITWFALVLIFALLSVAEDNFGLNSSVLPNWLVPLSGATVLLGSGFYQYSRHWRVSPVTWIAGSLLLVFGLVNVLVEPTLDLTGLSLLSFAAVILFGLLTGET
ncbi:MAG: hypothetical protein ACOYL5_03525 [Phototrophicaceae bacterium]|jgi:hypothetical protein